MWSGQEKFKSAKNIPRSQIHTFLQASTEEDAWVGSLLPGKGMGQGQIREKELL